MSVRLLRPTVDAHDGAGSAARALLALHHPSREGAEPPADIHAVDWCEVSDYCERHGESFTRAEPCWMCIADERSIDAFADRDNRPDEAHHGKPVAPQRATVIPK
jgi:hypothetical protein